MGAYSIIPFILGAIVLFFSANLNPEDLEKNPDAKVGPTIFYVIMFVFSFIASFIAENTLFIFIALVIVITIYIIIVKSKESQYEKQSAEIEQRKIAEREKEERGKNYSKYRNDIIEFAGSDIEKAFEIRDSEFRKIALELATRPTQTARKHDSAIMGGMMDGLFGPVAGVYTAIKTEQYNASVDEFNADINNQISQSKLNVSNSAFAFLQQEGKIFNAVYEYVKSKSPNYANQFKELYNLCNNQSFYNAEKICLNIFEKETDNAVLLGATIIECEIDSIKLVKKIENF